LVFSSIDPHQSLNISRPIPPGQDVCSFQVMVSPAAVAIDGAARVPIAAYFLRKSRLLVVEAMVSSSTFTWPLSVGLCTISARWGRK